MYIILFIYFINDAAHFIYFGNKQVGLKNIKLSFDIPVCLLQLYCSSIKNQNMVELRLLDENRQQDTICSSFPLPSSGIVIGPLGIIISTEDETGQVHNFCRNHLHEWMWECECDFWERQVWSILVWLAGCPFLAERK